MLSHSGEHTQSSGFLETGFGNVTANFTPLPCRGVPKVASLRLSLERSKEGYQIRLFRRAQAGLEK
jgi:hypothetical protein